MPVNPRNLMIVGGLVGLVGVGCYGAIIYPMSHAADYMKIQDEARRGLNREEIQPGGMRIWSNPFSERTKEEPLFVQKARKQ